MSSNSTSNPQVVSEVSALRRAIRGARDSGLTIGLVPTMGALHEGHLSLVRRSVDSCDFTIVTIFVNPAQFGPQEDLAQYPQTLDTDLQVLGRAQTNLVFTPDVGAIYPPGFSTYVEPPDIARPLEGQCRPNHFRGVATIVLKLFNLAPADVAYFGQKDFQQARVIEDMVRDLDLPLRIEVCPIVREVDGLAMSSRNRYLSAEERDRSLSLFRALTRASQLAQQGQRPAEVLKDEMRNVLLTGGVSEIEYATLVDPQTLQEVDEVSRDTVALIAARVGSTRLIDNCRLGELY